MSSDHIHTDPEAQRLFGMCRKNRWKQVLATIHETPSLNTTKMVMDNHIHTTILHQAITSKGDTNDRYKVIRFVLETSPDAAKIKNGYGSLALHVICQRNTKMRSRIKEELIRLLMTSFPQALVQPGGVGKRTPLHIAFTDYISPQLAKDMIDRGREACRLPDKKGWLPIHVACSRHASPEKLRMLLEAYPESLWIPTHDGDTITDLAKNTATKSHPNFCLIAELDAQAKESSIPKPAVLGKRSAMTSPNGCSTVVSMGSNEDGGHQSAAKRPRRSASKVNAVRPATGTTTTVPAPPTPPTPVSRRDPAELLLHFSRSRHFASPVEEYRDPSLAAPSRQHRSVVGPTTNTMDSYHHSAYEASPYDEGNHMPQTNAYYPDGHQQHHSVFQPYDDRQYHHPPMYHNGARNHNMDGYGTPTRHGRHHHHTYYPSPGPQHYAPGSVGDPGQHHHPPYHQHHHHQHQGIRYPVSPSPTLKHYHANKFDGEVAQV